MTSSSHVWVVSSFLKESEESVSYIWTVVENVYGNKKLALDEIERLKEYHGKDNKWEEQFNINSIYWECEELGFIQAGKKKVINK
jgi:hypothetical protein